MKRPGMYIFVNKGLHMSAGKLAAQASHAAVEAYKISDPKAIEAWEYGKHYAKYVMQARDAEHIVNIKRYLEERNIRSELIIDEGLTEIEPHQVTALGVEIVDRGNKDTFATFSTFELYRDVVETTVRYER